MIELTEQVCVTYCMSSSLFFLGASTDADVFGSAWSPLPPSDLTIWGGRSQKAKMAAISDIMAAV